MTIVSDVIFKLIKQSYPDINIKQERNIFHYERPKHEQSPLRAEQSNLSSDTRKKEQSSNA